MRVSSISILLLILSSAVARADRPSYQDQIIAHMDAHHWVYFEPKKAELQNMFDLYTRSYQYTERWFKYPDELLKYTVFFKSSSHAQITAFIAGTFTPFGLKLSLIANDGTRQSLVAVQKIMQANLTTPGVYSEVSAKIAGAILRTQHAPVVSKDLVFKVFEGENIRVPTNLEINEAILQGKIPDLPLVRSHVYVRHFTFEDKEFNEFYVMVGNPKHHELCTKKIVTKKRESK